MVVQTYQLSTLFGDALKSVMFFVLVVFTQVGDSGSSSSKFPENFVMAHFVVKSLLLSNRPTKFKSSVRYHRRLGILDNEATFLKNWLMMQTLKTARNYCMS